MNIFKRISNILSQNDFYSLTYILLNKLQIPITLSAKYIWKAGKKSEVRFWDNYYRTKGLQWNQYFSVQFDPDFPLQERPAELLPSCADIQILDVGAGPQTYLGKKIDNRHIVITAIDPLAEEYNKIFHKYQLSPIVKTLKMDAEKITQKFQPDTFDLVFARNCLDHSYNPEKAILNMIQVVKNGNYVLLEHGVNEGIKTKYWGLHQWNFSLSENGDFIISSKNKTINMTRKYADKCIIKSEVIKEEDDNELLINRIQKINQM